MGKTNKLLILSLGTGGSNGTYQETTYQIGQKKEDAKFIAKLLIDSFEPDRIIVVGTVKSNWGGLYEEYGEPDPEATRQLEEIWKENEKTGIEKRGAELEKINARIEDIFQKGLTKDPWKGRQVRVLLTRYGINEEELSDNYQIISRVAESLEYDKDNEVAFDITHSFRSIPLYNLIILNYLKEITTYRIRITHIYYGNLEVRWENKDKEGNAIASIVDLGELTQVLDLTNGVSEFKNTGNAVTLLQSLEEDEQDQELYQALRKFDWASQINALDEMVESLDGLIELLNRPQETEHSKYTGLRKMILEVITDKFFDGNDDEVSKFGEKSLGEKQFLLCRWYQKQNRYGQAVSTAMEALRSFLTPMYLRKLGIPDTEENCTNETYRKNVMQCLKSIYYKYKKKEYSKDRREIAKQFYDLEKKRRRAVRIRNCFAHNLDAPKNNQKKMEEKQAKQIIEQFIDALEELWKSIEKDRDKLEQLLQCELIKVP